MPAPPNIMARLDAALERARCRELTVRAIYLDGADLAELGEARGGEVCRYGGHEIRVGGRSIIYSTRGVGVAVPKRLSARVAA